MKRNSYKIKCIFIGHRVYEMINGFSIRVDINIKGVNKV